MKFCRNRAKKGPIKRIRAEVETRATAKKRSAASHLTSQFCRAHRSLAIRHADGAVIYAGHLSPITRDCGFMAHVGKSGWTIFWIGLVAGTLDITENIVFNAFRGITPWRIFQFIAGGLLGRHSFQMGWTSVALGVAIHYAIALTWTAIFFIAATKFMVLTRRAILSGLLYGIAVYVVMNFVVLPLSALPPRPAPPTLVSRINAVLALMFCIGLPIALLVRNAVGKGDQASMS